MAEKPIVSTFWHGQKLTPLDRICMASWARHGHSLRVFTYDAVDVPSGVLVEDAADVLPRESFFTFRGSPSAFTNIFRYKLLWGQGGFWVDTDVLCMSRELPLCDYYWAEEEPGQINGAVLKFPAGDADCLRLLRLSEERSKTLTRWGQLGPNLLTEILSGRTFARHCGFTEDAYPIHWLQTHFFWLPEYLHYVEARAKGCTFLHFWNSVFGRMGINLNDLPPAGSFLDNIYAAYGVNDSERSDPQAARVTVRRYLSQKWVPKRASKIRMEMSSLWPLEEEGESGSTEVRADFEAMGIPNGNSEFARQSSGAPQSVSVGERGAMRSSRFGRMVARFRKIGVRLSTRLRMTAGRGGE